MAGGGVPQNESCLPMPLSRRALRKPILWSQTSSVLFLLAVSTQVVAWWALQELWSSRFLSTWFTLRAPANNSTVRAFSDCGAMSGLDCPSDGSRVVDSRYINRVTRCLPFESMGTGDIVCRKSIEYTICFLTICLVLTNTKVVAS